MENQPEEIIKVDGRKKHYDYENYNEYKKETKYNLKYYHATKTEIECPICNKKTFQRFLKQHQRSMKCRLIQFNIVEKSN